MERFAQQAMLALLEGVPHPTIQNMIRFFADEDYQATVLAGRLPSVEDVGLGNE